MVVYRRIEDSFIRLIGAGAYLPGDYLPSIREVASKDAVNPCMVKLAYNALKEKGYVIENEKGYMILGSWRNTGDTALNISQRVDTLWGKEFRHDSCE